MKTFCFSLIRMETPISRLQLTSRSLIIRINKIWNFILCTVMRKVVHLRSNFSPNRSVNVNPKTLSHHIRWSRRQMEVTWYRFFYDFNTSQNIGNFSCSVNSFFTPGLLCLELATGKCDGLRDNELRRSRFYTSLLVSGQKFTKVRFLELW